MKELFLLLTLFSIFTISCTSTKDIANSELEWNIGENQQKVVKNIQIGNNGDLSFVMNSESFCSNSGVVLLIKNTDNELFRDTINNFPFMKEFNFSEDEAIEISTSTILISNDPCCKRLGNVRCKIVF